MSTESVVNCFMDWWQKQELRGHLSLMLDSTAAKTLGPQTQSNVVVYMLGLETAASLVNLILLPNTKNGQYGGREICCIGHNCVLNGNARNKDRKALEILFLAVMSIWSLEDLLFSL